MFDAKCKCKCKWLGNQLLGSTQHWQNWQSSIKGRQTDRQGDPMIGPHVHMGPIKISWINLIWAWKLSDIQCILTWIYISKSRDIQYSIFDGVCIWRWIKSWWPESRTAADQCLFIPSSISRNHWKKNSLHPSFWRGQIYNRNIWKQTPRQRQRRTKRQRRGRHAN